MHRTDRFRTAGMYAVNLATLTAAIEPWHNHVGDDTYALTGTVDALWFRRKHATTRACLGRLRLRNLGMTDPVDVTDPRAVLAADLDGTYGGDCHGRWDGTHYWGASEPATVEAHLAVLRPMLEHYPAVPDGYEGWWHF